jgi:hypothetical protein
MAQIPGLPRLSKLYILGMSAEDWRRASLRIFEVVTFEPLAPSCSCQPSISEKSGPFFLPSHWFPDASH